jgi:hypothetical protein
LGELGEEEEVDEEGGELHEEVGMGLGEVGKGEHLAGGESIDAGEGFDGEEKEARQAVGEG